MADPQPRRLWRVILVVSLAVNVAVLGAVGGLMLRSTGEKGPPRGFDVGLGPIGRALDQEDRRAIGHAVRDASGRDASRAADAARFDALVAALRSDPWSEADLDAALNAPVELNTRMRDTALTVLKSRLQEMTLQDRLKIADRMLEDRKSRGRR